MTNYASYLHLDVGPRNMGTETKERGRTGLGTSYQTSDTRLALLWLEEKQREVGCTGSC
jgi:hypothetical protein